MPNKLVSDLPIKNNILSVISLSLLTAACGGGSGTGTGGGIAAPTTVTAPTPIPTPAPVVVVYDTAEFRNNPSLAQMNVQAAYLNGATGDGVLVGVIDSGVTEVPELLGQLHPASTNIATGNNADKDGFNFHGTAMAGIIAAKQDHNSNNNFNNIHGSAFDAQILNINATTAADCPDNVTCSFSHSDIAKGYDYARTNAADVINESLGSDSFSSSTLVDAMTLAVVADIIIVVPAGNRADRNTAPTVTEQAAQLSAAVAYSGWANGQIIIAGSVDENNQISDFSYLSGDAAKEVFLVAPGGNITAPDYDDPSGGYVGTTGTSASTAQISGIAALLIQAFPNLSAKQVAGILFDTATDLGDPGPDAIFGRGLVNVQAAFTSQGQLTVAGQGFAAGLEIGNNQTVSQQNLIFSGGAFGADVSFTSAFNDIMVLDKYQRSFNIDLSSGVYATRASFDVEGFLQSSFSSRQHQVQVSEKMSVKMGWQSDDRFNHIDRTYFSNHLGRERIANNLRMAVSYSISDQSSTTVSSGMSLAEVMEDYRPDDYMAPGKHGFSALLSSQNSRAVSYKSLLGKKSGFETAYGSSKSNFAEGISDAKLEVENTIILNRFSHQPSEKLLMSVDLGLLEEKGSVLGAVSVGALEIGNGASTAFIGSNIDYWLTGNSQFFARASYGVTSVDQSSRSILGDISTLKSYSYLVGFKSYGLLFDDDQLSFTFSQPLRLAGGYASVSNAVSRNYQTNQFTTNYERISLNPTGTERDFEMSYSIGEFYGANLRLNMLHQLNPGHIKTIQSATSVLFRLGSAF